MQLVIKSSLRQAEIKDLLGVLIIFILLEDGGECGIGACELRPHSAHAIPFCWSRFGAAEKHIPSPPHHPLHHQDGRSSGGSRSGDNSGRDNQMVPLWTSARVAVPEEIYSRKGIVNNTHHLPTEFFGSHRSRIGHWPR